MPKKLRLPRKVKKAMLTKERKSNEGLGLKLRRAMMRNYMYQQYLIKLYKVRLTYDPMQIENYYSYGN